jgi:hypothetical protein
MRELYLSELRRFRKAALLAAPLHLLGLFLVLRFRDLMHAHVHQQLLLLFIYAVLAFGFGLYQFGSYRQPNRWIWLMHRPLHPREVAGAIGGASATLIAFVIGLPGLLALAGNQLLTTRVVDAYHYAVVLHGTLFAIAAWLCAAYVMLNRSRLGAAVVVLPFTLMFTITSIYQLLLLDALCIALLGAMVATAMKPDRHAPPQGTAAVLATALPLLLASYFVLAAGGGMLYQYAAIIHGSHPLNTDVPPAGGYTETVRSEPDARMLQGLSASRDPRAVAWRAAVKGKTIPRQAFIDNYPIRNQSGPMSNHEFADPVNKLVWTYSQDAAAFIGRAQFTGVRKAALPVDSLPILGVRLPMTGEALFPHHIAAYDAAALAWRDVLRVRNDETILGPAAPGAPARQYIVTSKRVVVMEGEPPMREIFGVGLPGAGEDLVGVDVAEVADGALISFVFGTRMIDGVPGGDQVILHIDGKGNATEVARRALTHDFPTLFEHKDWWISPVLHAIDALPGRLLATTNVFPPIPLGLPRPALAWAAASAAAIAAALAGWWWLRRATVTAQRRAGWIAACLLLGPPALLTLAVMERRRERLPLVMTAPHIAARAA